MSGLGEAGLGKTCQPCWGAACLGWEERDRPPHPTQGIRGMAQVSSSGSAWFCRDPAFLEQLPTGKALEVLEQVQSSLRERPRDWRDCVRWARRRWQSRYHDAIAQLLHNFPPEHVSPAPMGLVPPAPCPLRWPTRLSQGDTYVSLTLLFPVPGNQPRCPLLGGGQELSPSTDIQP